MDTFLQIQSAIFARKLKPEERALAEEIIEEEGEEVFAAFIEARPLQLQPSALSKAQEEMNHLLGISANTFAKYKEIAKTRKSIEQQLGITPEMIAKYPYPN